MTVSVVKIKKLHPAAITPKYAHGFVEDAGLDLHSVEEVIFYPGEVKVVKCGFAMELPAWHEAQIRSRSGLACKHGVMVMNSPGTIDPSYRGEIGVILYWSGMLDGNYKEGKLFRVAPGDRIAQMVINEFTPVVVLEVEELETSARGEGGYGSTGV